LTAHYAPSPPTGRTLVLDRDATGGDRLGYGYAITAHRSQGATVDTAYVLEDGGGRELAYVAMSRARHASHVYAAAPDAAEALDRLVRAWSAERRETWATDRGRPAQPPVDVTRLAQERRMLTDMIGRDTDTELLYGRHDLAAIDEDLANLHAGRGRWTSTPAGTAAGVLTDANARHVRAQQHTAEPNLGILERRRAIRDATRTARTLTAAQKGWDRDAQPEVDVLGARRAEMIERLAVLYDPDHARDAWLDSHPQLAEQIRRLDDQIGVQGAGETQPGPHISLPPSYERDIEIGL
jgi:hypothetical protein